MSGAEVEREEGGRKEGGAEGGRGGTAPPPPATGEALNMSSILKVTAKPPAMLMADTATAIEPRTIVGVTPVRYQGG